MILIWVLIVDFLAISSIGVQIRDDLIKKKRIWLGQLWIIRHGDILFWELSSDDLIDSMSNKILDNTMTIYLAFNWVELKRKNT